MSLDLGDLTAKLGVDTKGLDTAKQKMQEFGGAVQGPFNSVGTSITNFLNNPLGTAQNMLSGLITKLGPTGVALGATAGAVAAVGTAIFNMGLSAADAMEQLENLSAQTGMSTQDLQALQEIAAEAGLEGLDLGRTIGMLNKQLAVGSGDFVESLQKLGIEMTDMATGKPKDAVTLLDEMQKYLLSLPEGTERTRAAQEALSGRLRMMIPLLLNNKDGLKDMIEELKETGVVTSETAKVGLKAFDEAMDKVHRTWVSLKNTTEAFLGQHIGNEILMISKSFEQLGDLLQVIKIGTMSSADKQKMWNEALDKYNKTVEKGTDGTYKFKFSQEVLDQMFKWEQEDAKKLYEEQKRLREETEKAIKPYDDLAKKLDKQMSLGFSKAVLVERYREDILKSTESQVKFTGTLGDTNAQWSRMATDSDNAQRALKIFASVGQDFQKTEAEINDELFRTIGYIDPLGQSYNWLIDLVAKLDKEYKKTKGSIELTREEWEKEVASILSGFAETDAATEVWVQQWTEAQNRATDFGKEVSTIFTNMVQSIADNIIEWKGWVNTIKSVVKDLAKSILSYFLEGLFNPLRKQFQDWGSDLASWLNKQLKGLASTGGGSIGGGILGGGFAGIAGSAGILAMLGQGATSNNSYMKAGSIAGLGMASLSIMPALGLTSLAPLVASLSIPIIGEVIGAALAGVGLYKLAKGPNSYQAGSKEVARDFGISMSDKDVKSLFSQMGVSESTAWPIRKNLLSSPVGLQTMYQYAEQQGKAEDFLKKLEKIGTSWGTFDFRPAFEVGLETGDWTQLNKDYLAVFGTMEQQVDDWQSALMGVQLPDQEITNFRDALILLKDQQDATNESTKNMYAQFLQDGIITDDLRKKLTDLEANIAEFETYAKLQKLSKDLATARAEWETSGTVMEGLSDIFSQAGINLQVLDNAALLPGLKEGLLALQSFSQQMKEAFADIIPKTLTPIQQFLQSGLITPELEKQLADLIPDFYAPGGLMEQLKALGTLIEQRAALQTQTTDEAKAQLDAVNKQLSELVPNVLNVITSAEENTQAKIDEYTKQMQEAFKTAEDYITATMGVARDAVIEQLDSIIAKMKDVSETAKSMGADIAQGIKDTIQSSSSSFSADALTGLDLTGLTPQQIEMLRHLKVTDIQKLAETARTEGTAASYSYSNSAVAPTPVTSPASSGLTFVFNGPVTMSQFEQEVANVLYKLQRSGVPVGI